MLKPTKPTPDDVMVAAVRATVLTRQIKALQLEADMAKTVVRAWAEDVYVEQILPEDPEATAFEMETPEGSVTCIFPRASAEVLKGQKLDALEPLLKGTTFALVAHQPWTLIKTFRDHWLAEPSLFTKPERRLIEAVVGWRDPICRIETAK